ncbi:MAG: KUP/HAK/KT family potassium transporter, partial [Methylocella sp.]
MGQHIAQEPNPPAARCEARDSAVPRKSAFAAMALGSLGVVYGDIGTSPLYALRESLHHIQAAGVTDTGVIGTVSLLLWALFFTVTAKYVLFLMYADNKGEGGILSLLALARSAVGQGVALVFFL